jgi:hypothetical protein
MPKEMKSSMELAKLVQAETVRLGTAYEIVLPLTVRVMPSLISRWGMSGRRLLDDATGVTCSNLYRGIRLMGRAG